MKTYAPVIMTLGGIYMIWAHGPDIRFVATGAVFALAGMLLYRPDAK